MSPRNGEDARIRRPRVSDAELERAVALAKRPQGVTVAELIAALSLTGKARARLIMGRVQGVVAAPRGTGAGRGSRALVYHLTGEPVRCPAPGCGRLVPPGRVNCTRACTVKIAERRRAQRERNAAPA